MLMIQRELYEFGPFTIDSIERTLERDGISLAITPKVFDTLLYLVRNQGRILTKDELLQKIWPGTFVEEVNLAVNISVIRKLLSDTPQDPRYVSTVPGRGYRFMAQVRTRVEGAGEPEHAVPNQPVNSKTADIHQSAPGKSILSNPESQASEKSNRGAPVRRFLVSHKWKISVLAAVLLLALAGTWSWRRTTMRRSIEGANPSIAVLAFADRSQDKDQEYFSDGLTDELTNDLTKIKGLKVIARSSAFQFKGKNEDLRIIGKKLGVAYILEGSVRKDGNRISVTAGLTNAHDGFQLWSETYVRKIDDVFDVQQEIANAVAGAMQVRLFDPSHVPESSHLRNSAAYEPYLKAQYYYARGEYKDTLDQALNNVDQTIQLDDRFAAAWALRSSIINTDAAIGLRSHEDGYQEALRDAEKAIALDKNLAAGYIALAWVKINYEWDWKGAEDALKTAGVLQPGSAVVLSYRAYLYQCTGRIDEAIALTSQATSLDPLRTNAYLGDLLYVAGRYDEARTAIQRANEVNPKIEGLHARLALISLAQGRPRDALAETQLESGEWERLTAEALVYHTLNQAARSNASLAKLIALHADDSPYQVAEVYAYRGESAHAVEWLERAYRQRDPGLNQLKLDPLLRSIYSNERYLALLRKLGLSGQHV